MLSMISSLVLYLGNHIAEVECLVHAVLAVFVVPRRRHVASGQGHWQGQGQGQGQGQEKGEHISGARTELKNQEKEAGDKEPSEP